MDLQTAYQALSDPTRRRILGLLREGDRTAGEIAEQFDMSWPSVSRHLGVLRGAGLVRSRKSGVNVVYSLEGGPIDAVAEELSLLAADRKRRVVISTLGLSGDDAIKRMGDQGHYLLATILPAERFEIVAVASQRYRTPEETAEAVMLENPDAVGLTLNFEAHVLVPEVTRVLREGGLSDAPIFVAGAFPEDAIPKLKAAGVSGFLLGGDGELSPAFVRWLDLSLGARDAMRALEEELRDSYVAGSYASALYPRPGS